jgi:hypothetical protein
MIESAASDSFAPSVDPLLGYQRVERWAVGGLLLGILSPLALIGPLLWLITLLGIVANSVALRRIRGDANLVGQNAALVGLALSITFCIAPPAEYLTTFALLSRQGRETANLWFEYLRKGNPERAFMLERPPDERPPLNDDLWLVYRHNAEASRGLRNFVEQPLVRTLLALGEKAEVRYYKTTLVVVSRQEATLNYWYTVTYPDQGGKKTFFVRLLMARKPTEQFDANPWHVRATNAGFDPATAEH